MASCASDLWSKVFTYTPRGFLKTENQKTYEFDFGLPGRGIRTLLPDTQVVENWIDPFRKVLTEEIDQKLFITTYNPKGQTESRSYPTNKELYTWDWRNLTFSHSNNRLVMWILVGFEGLRNQGTHG